MKFVSSSDVESILTRYPANASMRLEELRHLIIESAEELELNELEETTKWNEPSYLTKGGSTIRIDWKDKNPEYFSIYFKCTSRLVETFREVFGGLFKYENNRAIYFGLNEEIPKQELKKCIKAALRYHSVKEDPHLKIR